jgi:hypothetical protein
MLLEMRVPSAAVILKVRIQVQKVVTKGNKALGFT